MSLFGTSGIRGDPQTLFTRQFCFDIGRAFALFLSRHEVSGPVALGYDPRKSSPDLLKSVADGLIYENRPVLYQGVVPIPSLNWLLKSAPIAASVMVSGSHIAEHLNGLKFFAFKGEILKEHEAEIEAIWQKISGQTPAVSRAKKMKENYSAGKLYEEMLVGLANPPYPQWQVVVDAGNGCQSEVMPSVLRRLGLKVIEINTDTKGPFKGKDTETQEAVWELQAAVRAKRADFGLAYDYDGDRVVFVDNLGQFIPGDYSGALLAKEMEGEVIVTPITTSAVIDKIGKKIIRTMVGSPYVVSAIKKYGASFGFEPNGGCIFPQIMLSRDGGSTTIKMLNLLSQTKVSLSLLVNSLPKYFLYKTKIDFPFDKAELVLEKAKKTFKNFKMEDLDGLKIWLSDDSWILFRSSRNAPEFRVFAEALKEEEAVSLAQKGIELAKSLL